jgi:dTDP-4-dehydrorhamnose reductase
VSDAQDAPPLLLLGSAGQIGDELRRTLAPLGHLYAPDRTTLDLERFDAMRDAVQALRPALIVNAAGYTDVERAEDEREIALRVNGDAVGVLGEAAARCGALVVHYSTDFVFDGEKAGAYVETDACRPISVYGESKLAGEIALQQSGAAHIILRVCWVYSSRRRNFLRAIVRRAATGEPLSVVSDQLGSPSSSRSIATATAALLEQLRAERFVLAPERQGIYHMAAPDATSWHGFAVEIVRSMHGDDAAARVAAVSSADYPTRARRPRNSRLDPSKLARIFGVRLPPWQEQWAAFMAQDGEALRGVVA